MKPLFHLFGLLLLLLLPLAGQAQSLHDGFMNGKGKLELAGSFTQLRFSEYYAGDAEGNVRVSDFPATQFMNAYSLYANYGLNKRVDLVANFTYTQSYWFFREDDQLKQQAFTPMNLAGKVLLDETQLDDFTWRQMLSLGLQAPMQDFDDNLAYSVGHNVFGIQMLYITQLMHKSGVFLEFQGGATPRFPSTPLHFNTQFKAGYAHSKFYVDAWLSNLNSFGGTDQLRGGDNFVNDNIDRTTLGGTLYVPTYKDFGLALSGGYVLSGKNTALGTYFSFSLVSGFQLFKEAAKESTEATK